MCRRHDPGSEPGKRTLVELTPAASSDPRTGAPGLEASLPGALHARAAALRDVQHPPLAMLFGRPAAEPPQRAAAAGHPHDTTSDAPGTGQGLVVQRKSTAPPATSPSAVQAPAGAPLPERVQAEMGRSFGFDFSDVRVSEGAAARDLGAAAFTTGRSILFAPGAYDPDSRRGRELLGHELAHVVQQAEGRVAPTVQCKGDFAERESGPGAGGRCDECPRRGR